MLEAAIEGFVRQPESGDFDDLARRLFALQVERLPTCRRLAAAAGVAPESLADWRRFPLAEASPTLAGDADGTAERLLRAALDVTLAARCLAGLERPPALVLLARGPAGEREPDPLARRLLSRHAGPGSLVARGAGAEARSWLAARQRAGRPGLMVCTTGALAELVDYLERRRLRFRLPPGSVASATGEPPPGLPWPEVRAAAGERLSLPAERLVRGYAPAGVASRFDTATISGGDPDLFLAPHWTRVRVLEAATGRELPDGEAGRLAILDLATVASPAHVLTPDSGRREGAGFRLLAVRDEAPRGR